MITNNLIKKSFKTVIENPSITLFLVLFLILVNFFTSYILTAQTRIVAMSLSICLYLLIAVFLSGWFQAAKTAVKDTKKNLYPVFFEGAGKNLISMVIAMAIYILAFSFFAILAKVVAAAIFGNLDFLENIPVSKMMESLNSLPLNQLSAIYGLYFCFICSMAIFNFLALFYFPSIFFTKNKNPFFRPFIALKDSFIFTFKNFFGVLLISVLIHVVYFILALISALFAKNALISILILFCYIYFLSIVIMLLFNYYDAKTNSNNGSDCIGQDDIIDSIGTKD